MTETLEEIAGQETVSDKPIEVQLLDPLAPDEPLPDPPRCDVLWIGKASTTAIPRAVEAWARVGTLVVSDRLDAADKGAAIGLVTEDERVRFEVDRPALASADLHASAQLLKLARSVQ